MEGRDSLDGDSLIGTALELSYKGFALGGWYANSPDSDYEEFNAWIEYAIELDVFEVYASFNWAIDSDRVAHADDALLEDFFIGGVSLRIFF